jgi:general secretion pathway protein D
MRSLRMVIDKLDIRRAQVLVEAIVAEVAYNRAAELGVTWAIDGSNDNNIVGLTKLPGRQHLRPRRRGRWRATRHRPGAGRPAAGHAARRRAHRQRERHQLGRDLRALLSDSDTNVLSTPSIVTMDNEEAEIKVGQEVPFLTGQFTNTGAAAGRRQSFPDHRAQGRRPDLKVTPKINEGDAVIMTCRSRPRT